MGGKSDNSTAIQATTIPGADTNNDYYSKQPVMREAQPDAQNQLARLAGQLANGYGAGGPGYEGTTAAQFSEQMEPFYQPVNIPDFAAAQSGASSPAATPAGRWVKPDMSASWRYGGPAGMWESMGQGNSPPLMAAVEGEPGAWWQEE